MYINIVIVVSVESVKILTHTTVSFQLGIYDQIDGANHFIWYVSCIEEENYTQKDFWVGVAA